MNIYLRQNSFLVPDFIAVQRNSFSQFLESGLIQEISKRNPITNSTKELELCFYPQYYKLSPPELNAKQSILKNKTYSCRLYIPVKLTNKRTKTLKLQWVVLGNLPLMTKRGHFIINGSPRVIINQMVRSPGVYFKEVSHADQKLTYYADLIAYRGAWLRIELDKKADIWARMKKTPKLPMLILLQALGLNLPTILKSLNYPKFFENLGHDGNFMKQLKKGRVSSRSSSQELSGSFNLSEDVSLRLDDSSKNMGAENVQRAPLQKSTKKATLFGDFSRSSVYCKTQEEALWALYALTHPLKNPDEVTANLGKSFLYRKFMNSRVYDLSPLGRLRLNQKLNLSVNENITTITAQDLLFITNTLINLNYGVGKVDDIDNLKNRRIRTAGELVQNQFGIGLLRLEKIIREKLKQQQTKLSIGSLINTKPINGALREFFGSSPLSQFMDQTNPLAEITHKRRLSSLGPGGVNRETAGMAIRGIHPTHYGRICPIETPEGQNAGLVNSLTIYSRVNPYGFIETPFYKVVKGQVQNSTRPIFFSAYQEEKKLLAPGDIYANKLKYLPKSELPIRKLAEFTRTTREKIDYISVSPLQMISIATSLIPFLEHDDANRALMGSNMQRQAVPLMTAEAPVVGTGLECRVASDSGHVLQAKKSGFVTYSSAEKITILSPVDSTPAVPKLSKGNNSPQHFHESVGGSCKESQSLQAAAEGYLSGVASSSSSKFTGSSFSTISALNDGVLRRALTQKVLTTGTNCSSMLKNQRFFVEPKAQLYTGAQTPVGRVETILQPNHAEGYLSEVETIQQTQNKLPLQVRFGVEAPKSSFDSEATKISSTLNSIPQHPVLGEDSPSKQVGWALKDPQIQTMLKPKWHHSAQTMSRENWYQNLKGQNVKTFTQVESGRLVTKPTNTKMPMSSLAGTANSKKTGEALYKLASSESATKSMDFSTKTQLKPITYELQKLFRSNQDTSIMHRPVVREGEWVNRGDLLADNSTTVGGELSLGKNLLLAYMPWEGYNFEDAILISERLVSDDAYTSLHIERYEVEIRETKFGLEQITSQIPDEGKLSHLDHFGIAKPGTWVEEGDILIGKVAPMPQKNLSRYEKLLYDVVGKKISTTRDTSLRVPRGVSGRVIHVEILNAENLPPEFVFEGPSRVNLYIAEKRKIHVGDKMAGRHGNKGIISNILPRQDMPYLPDGTPLDMVLNPLGVPSRMNVGQIYECLLGLAGRYLGQKFKVRPFDEIYGPQTSRSLVYSKLYEARLRTGQRWLFNPASPGKTRLFDGRTGECFSQPVTVGQAYMLKLIHLVDEKIHARSIGPYSLVTQQPLRGRSKHGGQRLGEMEVWALEGFGAAYTLQELLTVKSDDIKGREQVMESIQKNKTISLGTPESFKVLIRELQSLCLDVGVYAVDGSGKIKQVDTMKLP
uniref:DNA-directed RNA polymerase subunit beta n=1 Tax=Oltmannsiellopsis viridis TaxID=51324 RepID=RPOB_OLTVI|nr:beta subunit of RNA polymerase [Oltmannsiellopsis viridis]Q20EX1.1 RecName: Full=DNA-directed RNA polymerase subunit beta; AltName: Full=PEP; AltName: Full=Plastid-encoded RNA polymerase subunit beta; Short=RNA polymerase subunit beta [Oltmannsiellopsis viridis]ABB81942.1 beta subunit of RNA polymerase [Oltmannsiellopsis viridis]